MQRCQNGGAQVNAAEMGRFKGIIGVDMPKAVLLLQGDSNNARRPRILSEIQQKQELDGSCARQEIAAHPSVPGPS